MSRHEALCPPLIAAIAIPCCPLSNAFDSATRAYRRLTNGTECRERDKQTDGHIAASLYAPYRRAGA